MIDFYGKNIAQNYAGNQIFEHVSIQLHVGARIGLVGRNGEGKSTLAKLIAGIEKPSTGEVGWRKGLTKALLNQTPHYEGLSVKDVLELPFSSLKEIEKKLKGIEVKLSKPQNQQVLSQLLNDYAELQERYSISGGYDYHSTIRKVSTGLGLQPLLGQQWEQLSGGERSKVELACMIAKRPDLIILDEPTNHLDLLAVDWLIQWLNQYDGSLVLISHDRFFLDQVITKVWEMDQGVVYEYNGNYTSFIQQREERLLTAFQHYEDQQKKIKKMKETIKRLKEWANRANPPNAGMHRQAKSMEKALNRIQLLQKPVYGKKVDLSFTESHRSGEEVFQIKDVFFAYHTNVILKEAHFLARHQERIAITGPNGEGKSTIFELLLGKYSPQKGNVKVGASVSAGYLSQHIPELMNEKTVLEAYREYATIDIGAARSKLAQFLFYGMDVYKRTKDLSGGERMRLRLAQLMEESHNVLLLDEPTNHLDIESREVLEEAIDHYDGTVITISHDRYFLNKYFPITYWLQEGVLTRYEGSISYAQDVRARQ
ncbi:MULTISPECIES: ribosomal protection-like ABC-F family protein [Bacillaceae]|uniref:ABC transporter ATP-binding protein n=1 Tax=Alkalicoccobacillus plakortidis TaxID=444060 RepID=A0A9D5HZ62_9BACI|nr:MULTISPECIES: ABC-F family ATP-binding cassette domain-containing protein [Bacillaceae]KQL51616.1 ABC transporter ATP-binding protein [Alkalicoccobacillus plakortidis]